MDWKLVEEDCFPLAKVLHSRVLELRLSLVRKKGYERKADIFCLRAWKIALLQFKTSPFRELCIWKSAVQFYADQSGEVQWTAVLYGTFLFNPGYCSEVESREVKRSLRQSDLVKYSAVQSILLKRGPVQSSVVMEVSDSQSRLYTSNKNALKWVKKSITRTAQLKKRRSFEVRRFLKVFQIFFLTRLSFPKTPADLWKHKQSKGRRWFMAKFQHWDISRAELECFTRRYS